MKKIALSLLACCAVWQVNATEADWLTDFSKAQAKAKADNRMVLMDFNGSDWCAPCKALRQNVLSSSEFVEYAKKHLVLLDIDFPKHKEQDKAQQQANQALAEKFGVEGYPTVVVLNSDGKEIKKSVGYDGESAKDFIAELEKLQK
jgi:thioredoxin-related protein